MSKNVQNIIDGYKTMRCSMKNNWKVAPSTQHTNLLCFILYLCRTQENVFGTFGTFEYGVMGFESAMDS